MFLSISHRTLLAIFVLISSYSLGNPDENQDLAAIPESALPEQKWLEVDLGKDSFATKSILRGIREQISQKDIDAIVLRVKKQSNITQKLKDKAQKVLGESQRPVLVWVESAGGLTRETLQKTEVLDGVSTHVATSKEDLLQKSAGQRVALENGNTYILSNKVEWLQYEPTLLQRIFSFISFI